MAKITILVREAENRLPGLYAIVLDDSGERKFHYWRERAPIRDLFSQHTADQLIAAAKAATWSICRASPWRRSAISNGRG